MDSLHSRISFYTAVSVLVVFISTTIYVCLKLILVREKSIVLAPSSPRNPTASEQPLLVNKWTQTASLQVVVESFIQEKQKIIDSMRKTEIRHLNRYLDSIVLAPTSPGLFQSALYIPNDSVYQTIKSRSNSEQEIKGEECKTFLGGSKTRIVSNSFLGATPRFVLSRL